MERENKTLELVREIGFDNSFGIGRKPTERVFFMGPLGVGGREVGAHATPEAIAEFIDYWQHQIAAARDYVANGCDSNTMEWAQTPLEPVNRSCEYEQNLLLEFCARLAKQNLLSNAHEAEIQTTYFIDSRGPSHSIEHLIQNLILRLRSFTPMPHAILIDPKAGTYQVSMPVEYEGKVQ
jgi:hypothetical protein